MNASLAGVDGIDNITGITGTWSATLGGLSFGDSIAGLTIPDPNYQSDDLPYLNGGPYLDTFGLTAPVSLLLLAAMYGIRKRRRKLA